MPSNPIDDGRPLTHGDRVRIIHSRNLYVGAEGEIVHVDKGGSMFLVKLDDGTVTRVADFDVRVVTYGPNSVPLRPG